MVRKQFIEAVEDRFGKRLVRKANKSMDSYYLDTVRRGKGVFWIDYDESGNKGFRIHLQKVKKIREETQATGFGKYPVTYLSKQSHIPSILRKVEEIISHIDETETDRGERQAKHGTRKEARIKGIVTARKCKHCGHHEIGIITEGGGYLSLKSGNKIEVIKQE